MRSRVLGIVAVSVVCLIGGCLLAWWQWTRYESASGTLQNLGYVLQWPLFGVFPAFMFWRIYRAARLTRDATTTTGTRRGADEVSPEWTSRWAYVQKRSANLPAERDEELVAYNDYLAKLAAQEERHAG